MQILLVLGAIVAIIYYVIQMRANARAENESPNELDKDKYDKDAFYPHDYNYEHDKMLPGDPYTDLEKLASLYEKGILTKDEYDAKKKELLERI